MGAAARIHRRVGGPDGETGNTICISSVRVAKLVLDIAHSCFRVNVS